MIETSRRDRASAISLSKVQERAPDLVSLYKTAGTSIRNHGLEGVRAAVYLVLDRSGSMRPYYANGTMQHLAEQVLTLSAHLDDDGTVPVVFFSTDVDGTTDLNLGGHRGRINKLHENLGHMGRTNYHWAMDEVIDHYLDSASEEPALVIFQTDGGPGPPPSATCARPPACPCSGSSSASATPLTTSSRSCASSTPSPYPTAASSTTPASSTPDAPHGPSATTSSSTGCSGSSRTGSPPRAAHASFSNAPNSQATCEPLCEPGPACCVISLPSSQGRDNAR